ncbi:DUF456 domain-containing protein [Micromonospora sp. HM5-17]|uniref:DUF456 domain-containing protein n=1 Tax=Micromonospora sp. HM5-17 TaxID=2487710 RepID=UPI000F4AC218|nr:DUF456 domain-containing protein [Micromonospora sp. HM5-17]ROT32781.1 DUF456 domain-containing protein [Micromonospora sp. HM5-17]
MEMTDTEGLVTLLCGVIIVVGVVGVLAPIVPGIILCWLGVLIWAIFGDGSGAGPWVVLALATLVALIGTIAKYLWPGRNLKRSGVPNLSLLSGGVLGVVGFFVVPMIGLVLGFVLGLWLAELIRLGDPRLAWPSTRHALQAVGLALLVELAAALVVTGIWLVGLVLT